MHVPRISKQLLFSLLACFLLSGPILQAASESTPPCVANFESAPKPLNPYFLGANTSFFNRPYDYTNSEVVRLTTQLGLQTIRFPAGSPSNWYNWKTGTFYSEDILAKRVAADALKANKSSNQLVTMGKYHPALKVDDMVAFCRAAGAIPIWVANLMSGTPGEAAEWVAYNKKAGYTNKFWELGNEMYLRPYQSQFPTVNDYIKAAREYTAAMKAADPSIQVAINGTSLKMMKSQQGDGVWVQNNERSDWDAAIGKESFYDAVVIHDYFVTNLELIGKNEDEVHRYLMAHNPINMAASIEFYRKSFGKNVQLWMTEWNLFSYLERASKTSPDTLPKDFEPTHYWLCRTVDHALFVADWYLQALRYPENIKITNIHVLCSQGFWGLFQLPAPEKDNVGKPFLTNPPYYVVSWLGDILKKTDTYKFAQIENGPTLQGAIAYAKSTVPGVVAGGFFKGENLKGVMLINKTTDVQHISFKGIGQASANGATSHCLTGSSPIEDWGADKSVKNEDVWRPAVNINDAKISSDVVDLPPASLTYITFP